MKPFSSVLGYLFPALVALLSLLPALRYLRRRTLPVRREIEKQSMTRRDHLLAWGLAAIYAIVAFVGLGNTDGPRTYYTYNGESAVLTLPAGTQAATLRFYSGLGTGNWTLEQSADGESWETVLSVEQNYISVLKWNDAAVDAVGPYLRLSADGELRMGELALYDGAGERITPVSGNAAAAPLLDEGDTVPEGQTYMNSSIFDEIYHARTALEQLRGDTIYEITHPPLGKEILSLGMLLFGVTPFGWRFMGTLCGVLMLPLLYAFLQRLFGRREVSATCTLLFAFDFMHYVQTRLATIDTYAVLFTLLMYYYMYRYLSEGKKRRHLALSGLFFGMGAASKWTCLYAGAGLGLIWLLYWIISGKIFKKPFWKNVAECLLFFVAVPAAIYCLSYWPYGRAAGMSWPGMLFRGRYYGLIWRNQQYMWSYHSALVATHPYSSKWWQWIFDIRPILYYLQDMGTQKSVIGAFTSPLLCWGGLIALAICGMEALVYRDKRAGFITLGYLAQLLPWVLVPRLTFAYHYFPSELFLVLALGYVLSGHRRRGGGAWLCALLSVSALGLFAMFYPVLSGVPVSKSFCEVWLHWFPSWPV